MSIIVYAFEDDDGAEDGYTTIDAKEADERARRYGMLLKAYEYEFSDMDYVADYRSAEAQRASPVAGLSIVDEEDE